MERGNEVFDEEDHKMTLKFTFHNTQGLEIKKKWKEIYCCLCSDEIDTVLGYYNCAICKSDYCKECAFDRNKMNLEVAENPMLVPSAL